MTLSPPMPVPTDVKREIIKNYMTPVDSFGLFHTAWPMALLFGLFAIAAQVHPIHMIWLVPLIGWADYRIYFPLHDTCHFSLFKDKKMNRFAGYIMAATLVTPYDSFRKEHVYHHAHYSTEEDPGHVDYYVKFKNRKEMLVFLLSPLWGGTLLNKLKDYFRQIFGAVKPAPTDEIEREKPDYKGYLSIIIMQTIILAILTSGFQIAEFWRYIAFVILPGATVFLFLSRLRMFLEHGSLDYEKMDYFKEPRITSRTFECNGLELAVLSGAGFKYHYEHHMLPAIPSCNLKTVHEKFFKEKLIDPEDTRPSYVMALRELWRSLD